jgi:hypothetical protein
MKRSLFNFFILQLVVWFVVFYDSSDSSNTDVNHAAISATWEVSKVEKHDLKSFILHYPTFHQLTLNNDGSFVRLKNDEAIETGSWRLNKSKTKLMLVQLNGIEEYDIIQLPVESSQSFILKENIYEASVPQKIEYELTRM